MLKKLTILSRVLPEYQGDIRYNIQSLFSERLSQVIIAGSAASGLTAEEIINWAVLGEKPETDIDISGGCDLYIGIKTPKDEYLGKKTENRRFNRYQFGEIGFELAKESGIPAILLDQYNFDLICKFVENNTE